MSPSQQGNDEERSAEDERGAGPQGGGHRAARAMMVAGAVGFAATFVWGVAQEVVGPEKIADAKRRAFSAYRKMEKRLQARRERTGS